MLDGWTLNALWQFVFSSASVANLIGAGAVAVAILTPPLVAAFIPNLRVVAICVAAAAFSYSSVAGKFYHDGLVVKQAEWDASLKVEATRGEAIHEDAVRDVAAEPPAAVRDDARNRDNWKQ